MLRKAVFIFFHLFHVLLCQRNSQHTAANHRHSGNSAAGKPQQIRPATAGYASRQRKRRAFASGQFRIRTPSFAIADATVGNSGLLRQFARDPRRSRRLSSPVRPLPSAERVGVDMMNQLPMTLEEAIEKALQNNNDIDTSRNDVQIAEFNLRGARGIYDPLLVSENYYESATTPVASTIGGATNGSVTQTRYFGSAGVSGFSPVAGGSYSADFNSSRTSTSNTNATLNPQFPSALTLSYVQPLFRGLRFDINRRNIEIARKNLSLTDAQFRQRAIEGHRAGRAGIIGTYFSRFGICRCRLMPSNKPERSSESNQRLVSKGVLAPIDVIAATTSDYDF